MAKKVKTNFTVDYSNRITARNIYIDGDVYMTCQLNLKSYPNTSDKIKECDTLSSNLDVIGDLFINSDIVSCENAVWGADLKDFDSHNNADIIDPFEINITNSETFNSINPIKNVYLDAGEVRLYGKMIVTGNITICSDDVLIKVRNAKINKLQTNIKK